MLEAAAESSVEKPPCARSVVQRPLLRRRRARTVENVRDMGEHNAYEAGALWCAGRARGYMPREGAESLPSTKVCRREGRTMAAVAAARRE